MVNLYVQSDILLLANVFENFRNKCIELDQLDPAHFLSAPRLAWQACLKKKGIELELLADIDILLMVEKGIRVGIFMQYIDIQKQIINILKIMIKTKESSYIQYLDGNSLYGWAISQKLPVDDFKWKRTMLKFIKTL